MGSIKAPKGWENCVWYNFSSSPPCEQEPGVHDCRWFREAINVDMFYSNEETDFEEARQVDEGTPCFGNILFEEIDMDTVANAI